MKTALITGGSRGIGLGCAKHLAKEGFAIAINGVRPMEQVTEALDEITEAGAPEVLYCQGDVGSAEGREGILAGLRGRFPRLNVLVNNAGVAPLERLDLLDTTPESYERLMRINLEGPFFLSQAIANQMVTSKEVDPAFEASIININSISATVVSTNRGEYCVSKAGLAMVTQLFAARLGEFGIPVYEVRPGVTRTDMTAGVTEKYDRLIDEGLCVTKRWGTPDDIGQAVAVLAGGRFPYSTGQVIMVDGGLTIPRL
ncbi:3-ketoacyl-ACP reductase [Haloferula sp. A504]|uniref:3-ketoacyl-ACP reductase n=1 Tax=Haloferula sp. A504 TaxID=3373601 RepID=UPI0031C0BC36|nr:3-ketoacyl-ACP reductase [Verrucomicrobiaceae bacterium E54]